MTDETDMRDADSGHVRNVSALGRLRAMLTERGVEYDDCDAVVYFEDARGYKAMAYESPRKYGNGVLCVHHTATPEQAIAATLGPLTERAAKDSEKDSDGCGTCHDTHESRWFHCSECGFGMSDLYTEAPWTEEDQPKHCPNCGRLIKED